MNARFVCLLLTLWMIAASARAQTQGSEPATVYEPTTAPVSTTATAPPPPPDDKKEEGRKVYSKKVRGLLWFEGTVGWARVEPDSFKSITVSGERVNIDAQEGIEYGGAAGIQLSAFTIGLRYKKAKLDTYDFNTLAVDLGFMLRFIPGVHPFFRTLLSYNFGNLDLEDETFTNVEADGGGASLGGGLRIPIIKWISLDAAIDYQMFGLYVRGARGGNNFKKGMAGSELAVSGALTFHFIQRHK